MEQTGRITFKGTPLTLAGRQLLPGDRAPNFTVLDRDLQEITLKDFPGKIKAISVTPSLDTPVCDLQARRFNKEAAGLPEDIVVLNISMDLPFAISRFCEHAGIDNVKALSDHRDASFGMNYGVLIKELRLLARSIFVIDRDDRLRYAEIVPELINHPDYDKALEVLNQLRQLPGIPFQEYVEITSGMDDEGYLLNIDDWDEKTAVALAEREGIKGLTKEQLDILIFIREHYKKYKFFPVLHAICKNLHKSADCVKEKFLSPSMAWKLAGLPKPDELVASILDRGEPPT